MRAYSGYKQRPTARMICASSNGKKKGPCVGDIGSPLVTPDIDIGPLEDTKLVGLYSWGKTCGNADYPDVYSNVASVRNWIATTAGV